LVPLGLAITATVLISGLYTMKRGNSALQQKLMRARIVAQATTIGLITYSIMVKLPNKKNEAAAKKNDVVLFVETIQ